MNLSKDLKLMQRFLGYLKPYSGWVMTSIGVMPVSILAAVASPWLMMKFIDLCLQGARPELLPWMIFLMLFAAVLGYLSDAVYTLFLQKAGQHAIYSMRRDLFIHTLRLPRLFFDRNPAGATLTRLTSDFEALGDSMAVGVLSLFADLVKIAAVLGFLFSISGSLTFLLILSSLPFIFMTRKLQQRMRNLYKKTWSALSNSTGFLQECLKGVATVQLYNAEGAALERYKEKNQLFYKAQFDANISESALSSMIDGLTYLAMVLILLVGAQGVGRGTLTLGAVIAFINAAPRIFGPIRDFTFQLSTLQRAFAALEHIEELFAEQPEKENNVAAKIELFNRFESLEFDRVSFRYNSDRPLVLKNVSFTLNRGDRIAVVGPTGSGKSTLIKLMMRAYEPYEGSIKINGIELRSISRRSLRRMIALMPQDAHLFKETISFNIGLNRSGLTGDDITRAARYVHADSFIRGFPGEYDFLVSEQGSNVSAGEAQLLCFARSVAGGSEMIILDEATSSVDSVTEQLIEQAIQHVFNEKTVIAIAHRLSTIRSADLILVLEDGRILERGKHQELMAQGGLYACLVKNMNPSTINL